MRAAGFGEKLLESNGFRATFMWVLSSKALRGGAMNPDGQIENAAPYGVDLSRLAR
jgi:hypothetical protein